MVIYENFVFICIGSFQDIHKYDHTWSQCRMQGVIPVFSEF